RSTAMSTLGDGEAHASHGGGSSVGSSLAIYTYTEDWIRLAGCEIALRRARASASGAREAISLVERTDGVHVLTPAPAGEFDVVARVPYIEEAIATVTLGAPPTQELAVVIGRTEDLVGGVVLDLQG